MSRGGKGVPVVGLLGRQKTAEYDSSEPVNLAEVLRGVNINLPHRDPLTEELRDKAESPTQESPWLVVYVSADGQVKYLPVRSRANAEAFAKISVNGVAIYRAIESRWVFNGGKAYSPVKASA